MIYGKKLKEIRERIGITQKSLASLLEIRDNAYGQYETEYVIIPIKHLNTLCNYFNISLDYIFDLSSKTNYPNSKKEIDKKLSGKRLKEFRKSHNYTQDKFAKLLNVSRTTITEYERGTNIIATPFLYTICRNNNISADYLLGKIDNPK